MVCLSPMHPRSWRRLWCCFLSGGLFWLSLAHSSQAQITLDGSLGPRGPLSGPNYAIPHDVGQIRGRNLFQSFGQFNIQRGESATFTGPTSIRNILSRVTGGQSSTIDGTLRSTIPGAHLYLLNPSGVLFGPNATLDVQGSFHISTADYLRLADGTRFVARLSDTTTLSVAPPAAFGFLGPTAAPITVQGSALSVPLGETLALVGGDLTIAGRPGTPGVINPAPTSQGTVTLGAPGGRIHLASVASAGEVLFQAAGQPPGLEVGAFPQLGKIDIQSGAFLDASGDGGGAVVIRGGRLLVDNALLAANTLGTGESAKLGIDVEVRGDMRMMNRSSLTTETRGAGAAGDIRLVAGSLLMEDTSSLQARGVQEGNVGNIAIEAPRVTLTGSARISSSTSGPGQGGTVHVTASDSVTLDGFGIIIAQALGRGIDAGNAGSIVIEAPRVSLARNGSMFNITDGPGQGGAIHITASDTLVMAGNAIVTETFGPGTAGSLVIKAPRVNLTSAAEVGSFTGGPGQGGTVHVTASDTLTLAGATFRSTAIFTEARGSQKGAGNAGNIIVEAPRVSLTAGAQIRSWTLGAGQGGTVHVTASDSLALANSTISVEAAELGAVFPFFPGVEPGAGAGNAGSVIVEAPRASLTAGAQISSLTSGRGQGGTIHVTTSDTLTLAGTNSVNRLSAILATATGTGPEAGNAANIIVEAPRVSLTAGAQIRSNTEGRGQGGTVRVTAADTLALAGTNSDISANTLGMGPGAGNAGNIIIEASRVSLSAGAQIGSGTRGPGQGGTVRVTASDSLALDGTGPPGTGPSGIVAITIGTEPGAGNAGSIVVKASRVSLTAGAMINSSTEGTGQGGTVHVTASDTLTLADVNSDILANALGTVPGAGNAGSIVVEAARMTLTAGAQISSSTKGPGQGGPVHVTASDTLTLAGTGPPGNGSSGILAITIGTEPGAGDAGSIVVEAPRVSLTDGAVISSSTGGTGRGGAVHVTASDTLTLAGTALTGIGPSSIVAFTAGTGPGAGDAGSIVVEAPRVSLTDGAVISSSTGGSGQGGPIHITASDVITLTGTDSSGIGPSAILATTQGTGPGAGNAGNVTIEAARVVLTSGAQISSATGGPGTGGAVTVHATDSLLLSGQASTELPSGVFSEAFGAGKAGQVTVITPRFTLVAGGQLSAETGGDGRGGEVTVQAANVSLASGAQIKSGSGFLAGDTFLVGAGQGGTITVTATDTIAIMGQGSGLSATTAGLGRGGNITLQASRVQLSDGATISAESTGTGNAGNVTITTQDSFLSTHGSVVTRATQADGGNIQITAANFLRLRDSAITAEVGGGASTVGGNITIDPQFIVLQNSQITANAFAGQGGTIRLQAQQAFLADPASTVSASSTLGINGLVDIQSPVRSITGTIAPLPQSFAHPAELLRTRCAERIREGLGSRFVLGGQEDVPLEPGRWLPTALEPLEHPLLAPSGQTPPARRRDSGEGLRLDHAGQEPGQRPYAPVRWPDGLDVECARWLGPQGTRQ